MPSKRKPTEQELKDRLWAMVRHVDFVSESIDAVESHADYSKWDADMARRPVKIMKVSGFEASTTDLGKIIEEVEGSCLTAKCKMSLLKALKEAK